MEETRSLTLETTAQRSLAFHSRARHLLSRAASIFSHLSPLSLSPALSFSSSPLTPSLSSLPLLFSSPLCFYPLSPSFLSFSPSFPPSLSLFFPLSSFINIIVYMYKKIIFNEELAQSIGIISFTNYILILYTIYIMHCVYVSRNSREMEKIC